MRTPTTEQRPLTPGERVFRLPWIAREERPHRARAARCAPVVLTGFVLAAFLVAMPSVARAQAELPNPLSGPGAGKLKRSHEKKIDRAWRELVAGNIAESRKRISRVPSGAAADLVRLQILVAEEDTDARARLATFCNDRPEYATGWITLSLVAETDGDEALALDAASRVPPLWPTSKWVDREEDLYRLWVTDRIAAAEELKVQDQPDDAIAALEAALALDPERGDAKLMIAEILMTAGDADGAEAILIELGDQPEALFLRGNIAESHNRWQRAMEFYAALPDGYPGRDIAEKRAQTTWRLTLLPVHAHEAMSSQELTRGQLAVILVSAQPRLKTLPGGSVPVMSDIVDEPGQREIITAVRLGIMRADRRGHVFQPNSMVDPESVASAVDRARVLLGFPPCTWCPDLAVVGSQCHSIPNPPGGEAVVRAMLVSTTGADQ